jgi:hypothetical protein
MDSLEFHLGPPHYDPLHKIFRYKFHYQLDCVLLVLNLDWTQNCKIVTCFKKMALRGIEPATFESTSRRLLLFGAGTTRPFQTESNLMPFLTARKKLRRVHHSVDEVIRSQIYDLNSQIQIELDSESFFSFHFHLFNIAKTYEPDHSAPFPTLLRPVRGPPLKRPYSRLRGVPQVERPAAIFYPIGHPTPYAFVREWRKTEPFIAQNLMEETNGANLSIGPKGVDEL